MISAIELSQQLSSKSKQIKTLQARLPANPSIPGDYVLMAELDEEIRELRLQQQSIGKQMLEMDRESEAQRLKQLDELEVTGAEAAAELAGLLTPFAEKTALAFEVLAEEHKQILALSQQVHRANQTLLQANRPVLSRVSIHVDPPAIYRLLKRAFGSSFGERTVSVHLPDRTKGFDIEAAAAGVVKELAK